MIDRFYRLHDLRLPAAYVASWTDTVDHFSSIYSLLPLGCGRFLAGSSSHSLLKVFDMQKLAGTQCRCGSLDHTSLHTGCIDVDGQSSSESGNGRMKPCNWNVFVTERSPSAGKRSYRQPRLTSPVYSLSSPSPYSPTVFAGLESHVIQLDLTSVYDRFPDPIYKLGWKHPRAKHIRQSHHKEAVSKWDPEHEVMCLAMYEQVAGQPALYHQAPIGESGDEIPGWDERWKRIAKKTHWNLE